MKSRKTKDEYLHWLNARDEYRTFIAECINNIDDKDKKNRLIEIHKKDNYYKGDLLPMTNHLCRQNMTTGDIDMFAWDYYKKVIRVIEQKRETEKEKESQKRFLKFMQELFDELKKTDKYKHYDMGVYLVRGDPPFDSATITSFSGSKIPTEITHSELIKFIELEPDELIDKPKTFAQERKDYAERNGNGSSKGDESQQLIYVDVGKGHHMYLPADEYNQLMKEINS